MTILLAWLLADFIGGIVHWIEDKIFVNSTMHFFDAYEKDNELHHASPAEMLKYSYWGNISSSAVISMPLTTVLWFFGAPTLLTLAVFFSTFNNLVHRFAHMPKSKVPFLVRIMQATGLFITFDHHWGHHFEGKLLTKQEAYRRYCPMTNWLNPTLDRIRFFQGLEYLTGVRK